MDLLRAYLFAALILHKIVWEVLRRRAGRVPRRPFRPIKALKIAMLAGLLLQCFLPDILPITSDPRVLRVAGTLVFSIGLAVAVSARVQLGRNWSDVESATVLPGQRLVAAGLYRHIRHPIYIGDILLVGGYELALNSWLWLLVLPLTAFVWKKALQEESLLLQGLAGYADYLRSSGRFLPRNVGVGVAAVAIAFALQFANVQWNYGGNWSALFCTGSAFPVPASVQQEKIHVFPNSSGYDGQFYHYIAHDPWPHQATVHHIDAPRLRYSRILVPALAYLAALGNQAWIDVAFHAVSLLAFGLGAWWLAGCLNLMGSPRYLGLLFLLIPAALISLDRVTVDLMLLALCCGFAYYAARQAPAGVYVILTFAMLTRETGFLLWGAYGLWLLFNRRWPMAALFSTAPLPGLAWHLIVRANTSPARTHLDMAGHAGDFWAPLSRPVPYPLPPLVAAIATALDYLLLAGIALAIVLTTVSLIRRYNDPIRLAATAFAVLPLALGGMVGWYDPFAYPRLLSPMLLFLIFAAFAGNSRVFLLPWMMVLPRIAMELAPKLPLLRSLLLK